MLACQCVSRSCICGSNSSAGRCTNKTLINEDAVQYCGNCISHTKGLPPPLRLHVPYALSCVLPRHMRIVHKGLCCCITVNVIFCSRFNSASTMKCSRDHATDSRLVPSHILLYYHVASLPEHTYSSRPHAMHCRHTAGCHDPILLTLSGYGVAQKTLTSQILQLCLACVMSFAPYTTKDHLPPVSASGWREPAGTAISRCR